MSRRYNPPVSSPSHDLSQLRIERGESERPQRSRPRRRKRRRGLGLLVLLAVLAGAGWLFWPRIEPFIAKIRAPEVKTGVVVVTRAGAELELTTGSGYVVARTRAALATKLIGRLTRIDVEEGSIVKKEQVVAGIEPESWEHQVSRLKAALKQAEAEKLAAEALVTVADRAVDRVAEQIPEAEAAKREATARKAEAERVKRLEEALQASGSGTPDAKAKAENDVKIAIAALDRAEARIAMLGSDKASREAEVASAKARVTVAEAAIDEVSARLAAARTDLADTELKAPFAGVVLRKEAEVGEMVVPALAGGGTSRGAVITIADFASLEIEVDVFERDIRHIVQDGPAEVVIDAFADRPLEGKVRLIVPTADRGKGTVLVKVTFDRQDLRVLPEMRGRVTFLREKPEAERKPETIAPADAIVSRDGRMGVFLLEGDRVRFREVAAGETRGARRVIASGLSGNETVVVEPPASLSDGMLVRTKSDG